jgi:hypothetical protein
MKSLRLLLAFGFATAFAATVVRAEDKAKEPAKDCNQMSCCKKKDGDDKASCAKDGNSCCCDTGDKAKEEKAEPKK